jgi:hypothetical protein
MSATIGEIQYSCATGNGYGHWTLSEIKDMRNLGTLRLIIAAATADRKHAGSVERELLDTILRAALQSLEREEKAVVGYRQMIVKGQITEPDVTYVAATVWSWFNSQPAPHP